MSRFKRDQFNCNRLCKDYHTHETRFLNLKAEAYLIILGLNRIHELTPPKYHASSSLLSEHNYFCSSQLNWSWLFLIVKVNFQVDFVSWATVFIINRKYIDSYYKSH